MQISSAASLQSLFPAQQTQAVAAHRESGESASVEARESTKTQIAEGEAVRPTSQTAALPGRLSIYA